MSGLAFSPDGSVLAVAGDEGMLELWDTASRQRLGSPLPTPGDTIRDLVFDQDGTTLRTAGDHTAPQTYNLAPRRVGRDHLPPGRQGTLPGGVAGVPPRCPIHRLVRHGLREARSWRQSEHRCRIVRLHAP
ncbi:WD40 repeat domain-containing protein [Streptomyces sp. NPDC052095]|uniref:WD40 repeat domain-containing protein n=1 Tax=unclassified Streptomyces TaxID=2593676 RepID=UPI00344D94A5